MAHRKTDLQASPQQPQTQPPPPPPPLPIARVGSQRRNLSYEEKLLIIEKKDRESTWTQETLALWAMETFGLNTKPTQATISNILRGRDKLQNTYVPAGYRSARPVKHPELDLAVLTWVLDVAENNEWLTRDAVQQRAAAIAKEMGIAPSISFSKGWMSSFMKRHQLNLHKRQSRHGGGGDAIYGNFAAIRQRLAHPAVARADAPEGSAPAPVPAPPSPPPQPPGATTVHHNAFTAPVSSSSAAGSSGVASKQAQPLATSASTASATTAASAIAASNTSTNKRKRSSGSAIRSGAQQQQPPPAAPQQPKKMVEQQQTQQQQPPAVIAPAAEAPQSPVAAVPAVVPAMQPLPSSPQVPTPPPKKPRSSRLSLEMTPDKEKEQQLFDLECQKLQVDLQARHVQLVVEKTLARKRLLDAGIPEDEVNKLIPM